MAHADYYERALTNGVLGIQRGREPGIMIYFLPMNPGGSKAISGQGGWGNQFDSFWCCYGTGCGGRLQFTTCWLYVLFLFIYSFLSHNFHI